MTAESGFSVSVVIPVFNGAATVGEVVERGREVLGPLAPDFEFVLVNDGSTDASWDRIEALVASSWTFAASTSAANYGQHNANLAGIRPSAA